MHLHNPCLVLIPDTSLSASDAALAASGRRSGSTSLLVQYIREEFPNIKVEPVGRRYWNDDGGRPYILFMNINLKRYQGLSLFFSFVWKMTNVQVQC